MWPVDSGDLQLLRAQEHHAKFSGTSDGGAACLQQESSEEAEAAAEADQAERPRGAYQQPVVDRPATPARPTATWASSAAAGRSCPAAAVYESGWQGPSACGCGRRWRKNAPRARDRGVLPVPDEARRGQAGRLPRSQGVRRVNGSQERPDRRDHQELPTSPCREYETISPEPCALS